MVGIMMWDEEDPTKTTPSLFSPPSQPPDRLAAAMLRNTGTLNALRGTSAAMAPAIERGGGDQERARISGDAGHALAGQRSTLV